MTPMTVVSSARRSMGSGTAAMRTAVPAMRTQRKRPMQDHTTRTRSHDPVRARSGRVGRNRSRSLGSASDAPSARREPAPRSAPDPARKAFKALAARSVRRPPPGMDGWTRGIGSVAATGGCPAGRTMTASVRSVRPVRPTQRRWMRTRHERRRPGLGRKHTGKAGTPGPVSNTRLWDTDGRRPRAPTTRSVAGATSGHPLETPEDSRMRDIRRTIRLSGLMRGGAETRDRQRRLPPTRQNFAENDKIRGFSRSGGLFCRFKSVS